MNANNFSPWHLWERRDHASGLEFPGVYCVAISSIDLSGVPFSWRLDIVYIGMTNASAGLRGRLRQFDNTIAGKRGHGGADRVRYKHQEYDKLCPKLFVAVAACPCDVSTGSPTDLRIMGTVAGFEYECFAQYAEIFGRLPEFNDKRQSRKYSLTIGRGEVDAS